MDKRPVVKVISSVAISESSPAYKLGARNSLELQCGHTVHLKGDTIPKYVWCNKCPAKDLREVVLQRLRDCKVNPDKEVAHVKADEVLCELLLELGYGDVVELFESIDKWYA